MTREQEALLLTTARILRAHLCEGAARLHPDARLDVRDLNDALKPFETNVVALRDGEST